jgi:hypothetical protein
MKRFITFILTIAMVFSLIIPSAAGATYTVNFNNTNYSYSDVSILNSSVEEQTQRMKNAHAMAEAARALGYTEDNSVITLAKQEWAVAYSLKTGYQNTINSLVSNYNSTWAKKEAQYPAATYIWRYLTETLGYNNYVAAGILGNIMGEVGGGTLNIQYWLKSSSGAYYGMCQWSKGYSGVWGADLAGQCKFLANTIAYEMNTYGKLYASGFNYSKFLNLTNEQQAAKAFARCYERGAASTYSARMRNATIAYNYFVG